MKKFLVTSALLIGLASSSAYAVGEAYDAKTGSVAVKEEAHRGGKGHFKEALARLPKDKQELIRNSWKQSHEENKADREKLKSLHEQARALLTSPDFDKGAFLAKSKEISRVKADMETKRADRMADVASKLTAQERLALAEAMPKHGMGRHHGDGAHRKM